MTHLVVSIVVQTLVETRNISPVWLEKAYSRPQNCFLGEFHPKMGGNITKPAVVDIGFVRH